ncbi:MAG: nodulation protein NfeD [Deltaproteobacteria bacterium]|nr:nodulation protein NfeD [Deltaproteobacteria bacterium]
MKRLEFLFLILFFFIIIEGRAIVFSSNIEVLRVEGIVVPAVTDYIERGITKAEKDNSLCVIELNTPGGLLNSTDKIVKRIVNSKVPVVVYVYPKTAWAASAGAFITLSAHIAAMTPGTTIGAAHPVTTGGEKISKEHMKKIVNFSAKWMETIAKERGRNIKEARLAVTESKSFRDDEALRCNLIDIQAKNLKQLISLINGKKVTLSNGKEIIIDTKQYKIIKNDMNSIEHFLQIISNPNIVYVLLTLAIIGLITEVSHPGVIFPGVVGGISLFLAFYSLGVLNAYWGGIALILLATLFFMAEIFTVSFGLLTAGGIISLVMGSLVLFSHTPEIKINLSLVIGVSIVITAFFILLIGIVIKDRKRKKTAGAESMVGKTAITKTSLNPKGTVLIEGELWYAISINGEIKAGEEVVVKKVKGLNLWVTKNNKEEK